VSAKLVSAPVTNAPLDPAHFVAVGLGIDCSPWVRANFITDEDMLDRNWAHWNTFCLVCLCWPLPRKSTMTCLCRMCAGPSTLAVNSPWLLLHPENLFRCLLSTLNLTRSPGVIHAQTFPLSPITCQSLLQRHVSFVALEGR
jgi:hypothetical protein